jgi:CHAT domain-containing protein
LLKEPLPPSLATTDTAVRKIMLEGIAHRYTQEFEKSEKELNDAENLATSFQPRMLCHVLNAKGALEVDEQKYVDAEATYYRALELAREHGKPDQEASARVSLAWVAIKREHFDEAVDRGQSALQLVQSLDMQSYVATVFGNMGWAYFELGDFENALEFYRKGAEKSELSGLKGYSAYWYTGVANTYIMLHDYASAEDLSKRTLERARTLNNAQTITECLNTLAEIALRTGRLDEAEGYNKEAIRLEEEGLDHFGVLESLLLSGRVETRKGHFDQGKALFHLVSGDPKADTPLRWEVQARLAELHDAENLPAKAEEEYRKSIETIQTAQQSIDRDDLRLSFLSGGIEFYDNYIGFLVRHKRPADALRIAELSRARILVEGLSKDAKNKSPSIIPSVRPEETAKLVKATLLFYWLGEKQSYLWVITPLKTAYFTLPKASEIEPVVKSYRKALLRMHDAQDVGSSEGKQLYTMLIEPAKELIPKGSRVIILPAESLYGLNFETLIVPDPQPHFWIEDVTLTTGSSLTLLDASVKRPATKEKNLLLVGNTEQPNPDFPALPQAPAEMKQVGRYFSDQNRKVLEGKSATPSAYLSSSPERYAYLHFVTHGTASRTRPLESAVILSKEDDSYKLYARDIVQHHLNANLVTISACNGSGTRAYSGEGLVGLSWAFLRAGAHNVIGALWEVSDVSTPELMDALYGGLSQGKDPATALRDAKLSLLHSSDPGSVFKKPFYWAPFQLYAGS